MQQRNWIRMREDPSLRRNMELRAEILAGIRSFFYDESFVEIDPPALIPLPGMEPHLSPFSTDLLDPKGKTNTFYLHTSPEYALKKLLSAGFERIYSLGHVFRNEEISETHNPECSMLEWYRVGVDYRKLMEDCERIVLHLLHRLKRNQRMRYRGLPIDFTPPWSKLSMGELMIRYADVDLERISDPKGLVDVAREKGYEGVSEEWPWEDLFYRIFMQEVEPRLPRNKPYFLVDYPVEMAALARVKPGAPRWVERFELYIGGLELANAFSELTEAGEQRRRLVEEKRKRELMGKEIYPVDNAFLEALERGVPASAGIAMGVDRLIMILLDAPRIRDVLPFPAEDLLIDWEIGWNE